MGFGVDALLTAREARCVAEDFALLEAWRSGDQGAGTQLFERHYDAIARFFKNKSGEAFEDLVQQTFLACVESKTRFEGRSSFRTFVFGVAHNVLKGHYRTKKRDGERFEPGTVTVHDLAPRATTMLVKRAEEEITLQALRRLPIDDQVILELYFWENLRATDIAEALDMPEGTVRTRIRRARIKLESIVAELSQEGASVQHTASNLDDWVHAIRAQLAD